MDIKDRIAFLVEKLQLSPHPEGGFYSETYRSGDRISTDSGKRNLTTAIYFLLTSENVSKFHRIKSDELWFFHEGSNLTIHTLTEVGHQQYSLGYPSSNAKTVPQHLVPANTIFGSTVDEPNSYALVSCVVAPGFDFRDFELFSYNDLTIPFPDYESIIRRLT
ncbi:putative cupin superfamily sugar epimerase [Algoriphagus sp. 4150]|uniref:cupin domain-containing protein n=1 Tax=Algoriphagus sp. 4150 TaxID=2817756 RepID=UPI00285A82FF|nr:cupin domain-containing protein [Algoriphagus sp. 4150]MDR7128742.1 putative cupin superfamily sugar epimerase [Algoriphagus sp. 4150]